MSNKKNNKDILYCIGNVTYTYVEMFDYSLGDTISYLIKTLLSIFNREKTPLKILILKRKDLKNNKKFEDLQKG